MHIVIHEYVIGNIGYQIDTEGNIKNLQSRNNKWYVYSDWIRFNHERTKNKYMDGAYIQLTSLGFKIDDTTGKITFIPQYFTNMNQGKDIQLKLFMLLEDIVGTKAEVKFKKAIVTIINQGGYPWAGTIGKELGRRNITSLNGQENDWRREICHELQFKLKGRNLVGD